MYSTVGYCSSTLLKLIYDLLFTEGGYLTWYMCSSEVTQVIAPCGLAPCALPYQLLTKFIQCVYKTNTKFVKR